METLYIDLNTVKSEDIYTIGYQRDHNVKTLSFTGCEEGVSYILLIGLPPEVVGIDLINNQWVITNTYTQYAGTFAAQVRKYVGGQWVAHSPVFFLRIYDSLGNGGKIEDVPPNFETKFEEMSKIISTVSKKLANGEFNGKSAYQIAVDNGFKGSEQEWVQGFQNVTEGSKQIEINKNNILNTVIKNIEGGNPCVINDSTNFDMLGMDIYGQSSQDGVPTPTEPKEIVNKEVNNINVHGTQLFDASRIPTKSLGGATVTNNDDGSFTISGNGKLTKDFYNGYNISSEKAKKLFKAGNLTIECKNTTAPYCNIVVTSSAGQVQITNAYGSFETKKLTQELIEGITNIEVSFTAPSGKTIKPGTIKPMLYQDGDGTWEPFKQPQSITLSKPITLRGVPVTNNGNIAIDGKQYISDVITEKDGVIGVERNCEEKVFNGGENWGLLSGGSNYKEYMFEGLTLNVTSNYFYCLNNRFSKLENNRCIVKDKNCWVRTPDLTLDTVVKFKNWLSNNNLKIQYQLAIPTFEPLPQADQDAIRKLKTYYPNTIINTNAFTNVKYVADTKLYIDNSIAKYHAQAQSQQAQLLSLMPIDTQATMIENDTNNLLGGI